jgi:sugar transferase (PEP-CTERM/EpsH1 system associated)
MRILWVKAGGLLPLDTGGKIRSYNILRELARAHEVSCFLFLAAGEAGAQEELRSLFKQLACVPLNLPRPKSFAEVCAYALRAFSRDPYNISKYCRLEVRQKLVETLERSNYDVVVCDFLIAARVIPWDIPTPKVIFTHNVESIIWKRHYETAKHPMWKALTRLEAAKMEAAEKRYLALANRVLAVSENDATNFKQYINPSRLSIISTGVDIGYFAPVNAVETPCSLVFIGSMDWLPNEDAVVYFIEQILPFIRQDEPQVSLSIVGRNPSPRIMRSAATTEHVEVTGRVEDIRPYLDRSEVCIVPLRIGSGTRLKIFEAMSMGKAVVSTSIGAEGLPVRDGEHILLADDPESFARATLTLLRDDDLRRKIGCAARKLVAENYSWAQVAEDLSKVLKDVAEESGRKPKDIEPR